MNREELQEVLMHLRREGPQAARVEEITHIQAGLEARLGCPCTAEEALWLCGTLPPRDLWDALVGGR